MLLNRALNMATVVAWGLFLALSIIYLIRTTLREGVASAVRRLFSRLFTAALLVLLALTFLSEALIFIEPQQVGVVVSLMTQEGYRNRPFRSGLHWKAPLLEQVYRYPIYWQTYTMSSKPMEGNKVGNDSIVARTSDGQEVSLDCTVIFRIDPEQAIQLHIGWQGRYVDDFVRPLLRGLIRTQVSQYTVDEVNSFKRLDLEKDLSNQVREAMEEKGFAMDRFLLRNIQFTSEYAAAVEQKQVAQQGRTLKEHEAAQIRTLAVGEAGRIETLASAEAEAIRIKAQAEAEALRLIGETLAERPDLITYRYVEKLGPGVRVMLVPSDVPYLLPLPNLEAEEAMVAPTLPYSPTLQPGEVIGPTAPITTATVIP